MQKRLFDFLVSLLGLIPAAPLIGILVLLVRRDSDGPGLFIQERVGKDGAVFRCYKLRTMRQGTANVPTHMASAAEVTPLGAFLRRTKLDELPQLFNILRGEMSFVGPRPCLPSQTELIEERRKRGVLGLLPGITGVAQVAGLDMSEPLRLAEKDAQYIGQQSLALDVSLIWRTVFGAGQGDRMKSV